MTQLNDSWAYGRMEYAGDILNRWTGTRRCGCNISSPHTKPTTYGGMGSEWFYIPTSGCTMRVISA